MGVAFSSLNLYLHLRTKPAYTGAEQGAAAADEDGLRRRSGWGGGVCAGIRVHFILVDKLVI
jgi:hypothetical protein